MTRTVPLLIACVVAAAVPSAHADVPSAAMSYVDPCIVTCPAGDSVFTVVARRLNGLPHPGGDLRVEFCACPDVLLAPVPPGGPYTLFDACTVAAVTDAAGAAAFPLVAGGTCAATINVYCDGIVLATRTAVASFDRNGDLAVDLQDLLAAEALRGTDDPTADFDCDGHVTQADVDLLVGHLGHSAAALGVGTPRPAAAAAIPIPNPGAGPIEFVLRAPARGRASLAVYDLTGRRIAQVLDRVLDPGVARAGWTGRDDTGRAVAPGLYFYRFTIGAARVQGTLVVRR